EPARGEPCRARSGHVGHAVLARQALGDEPLAQRAVVQASERILELRQAADVTVRLLEREQAAGELGSVAQPLQPDAQPMALGGRALRKSPSELARLAIAALEQRCGPGTRRLEERRGVLAQRLVAPGAASEPEAELEDEARIARRAKRVAGAHVSLGARDESGLAQASERGVAGAQRLERPA